MIKRIFKFKREVTEFSTFDGLKAYNGLLVALGSAIVCFAGWLLSDVTDIFFINFFAQMGVAFGGFAAVAFTFYSIYLGISHFILITPENKRTRRQIQIITLITLLPLFYFIDNNTMWDVVRESFFDPFLLVFHLLFGYFAYVFAQRLDTTTPIKRYLMAFIISLVIGLFNYHDHGLGEDEEPWSNEKIIALEAEIRDMNEHLFSIPIPQMFDDPLYNEVKKRERIISQIRIERDKTGGFYKYVHLIIFIYIGILLGTIKTLEFK
jgi:hypothetical protein